MTVTSHDRAELEAAAARAATAAIYRQVEQDGVGLSNDVQTHLDGGPR